MLLRQNIAPFTSFGRDLLTGMIIDAPWLGSLKANQSPIIEDSNRAGLFTVADFTWNPAGSVSTASMIEGAIDSFFLNAFGQDLNGFDFSHSIGKLLGDRPVQTEFASTPAFPDIATPGSPTPNVDRTTIELTWDGDLLPNGVGDDFVVYESGFQGNPEGYLVSVRQVGQSRFSAPRYEFADTFELFDPISGAGIFATGFDLSDFGLAENELINAVRIQNLFNLEADTGADRVTGSLGEGDVLFPGDPGYGAAYDITTGPLGPGGSYALDKIDADITYVAGLQTVLEAAAAPTSEGPFTVADFTWNPANSVSTASMIEGSIDSFFLNAFGQDLNGFDFSQSIGRLLGDRPAQTEFASTPAFPDIATPDSPTPNVDRTIIELTWDGDLLPNGVGDDLVVYESGFEENPEGYLVSVRQVGQSRFSAPRYEFADTFELFDPISGAGVFATGFDLSDFGLAENELIDAVRIQNLFNLEADAGADRVTAV